MTKETQRALCAITAFLMLIAVVIPSFALPTFATEIEQTSTPSASIYTPSDSLAFDPTILEAEQITSENIIFRNIDWETFSQNSHSHRLVSEEDLNTYVFKNQNGSKTVYYMGENVKFVDSLGQVKDKDIQLTTTSNGFKTRQNEVSLNIPTNPSSGITLGYKGYSVSVVPYLQADSVNLLFEDNTITYVDYFGSGIDLKYTPTLSGVKEDIILESYTGINSFKFILNTDGLRLVEQNGNYYLSDTKANVISLGSVVVYDSIGKPEIGFMDVETIQENQQYLLTIGVSKEYLLASDTFYPVTIDPTLTISDNTDGANAIQDAPIFKNLPAANFGNFTYNRLGNAGTYYGVGRTVARLNGLLSNSEYQAATASEITSSLFYIKETSGSGSVTVNVYPLLSNTSWTETNVTWNNVGTWSANPCATNTIGGNSWTAFDITFLVRAWKSGTNNPYAGFIMISASEDTVNKSFASSEFTTTSYRPYVVVTYTSDAPTLNYSSVSINNGSSIALTASGMGGNVTWSSSNTSIAFVSSNGVVTGANPGIAVITCTSALDGRSASCTITVNPTSYTALALDTSSAGSLTAGRHYWYTFTPAETGYYMFKSSSVSSTDVKAYLYNGTTQLADNNDGAGGWQFEIRYRLVAGTQYRICVQGVTRFTTGAFSISTSKCWPVATAPTMYSRSDWGASDVIQERLVARTRAPERVIYHHSADKFSSTNIDDCKEEIQRIQNLHMYGTNPKCDIAYHFIIDPAGRIWQGAAIDDYQRGHADGHYDDIGVLVLGDFESRLANLWTPDTLNDAQKNAMVAIGQWLCYAYDLPLEIALGPIATHRQVVTTECPGENMAVWVENDLVATIRNWRL